MTLPPNTFSLAELNALDALWRANMGNETWTGWAVASDHPESVKIFRTRANWRVFRLTKDEDCYHLADDDGSNIDSFKKLDGILTAIEAVPGLAPKLDV